MSVLRPIVPADHGEVLALNERFVELLSPLDEAGLVSLIAHADRADVITADGELAGFVVTVPQGTPYASQNYRWFTAWSGSRGQQQRFRYLDRVVLDPAFRRRGLASAAYDELEASAPALMALEVVSDPPNVASLAFHEARGYRAVGEQVANGHRVQLMVKELTVEH